MRNKFAWLVCAAFTFCEWNISALADSNSDDYAVMYQSAWRDGIDPRLVIQAPSPTSISTIALPEFNGVALEASMLRSDDFTHVANGTPRAEVSFTNFAHFAVGNEYQVRWSTMIPSNYQLDSQQPEIITQLHQSGSQGSPPFALMLAGQQYQVDVRGGPGTPSKSFEFGIPAADEGKVVSWLLSYRPDDTGFSAITDLYKEGALVVHAVGYPNAYPSDQNAYLKIGVYKWWWLTRPSDVTQRTMYYGDVEILGRPAHQDLIVNWGDPQMGVLASTYDASYVFDWQNGIDPTIGIQRSSPADISVVSDPVVSGRNAARVSVMPGENFTSAPGGVPQAQLMFQKPLKFTQGKDYLIRWSTFVPPAFPFGSSQVIAQIHQGALSGLPPIALSIVGSDYTFSELGGTPLTQRPVFGLCCATADQGKWVNWALRYVPDATGQHAQTQLWKNGTSVYASRGKPNAYSGDNGSYFVIGLYLSGGWQPNASNPVALLFGPVSAAQR